VWDFNFPPVDGIKLNMMMMMMMMMASRDELGFNMGTDQSKGEGGS